MEILKNFVWDIQRFAILDVTTSGTYYADLNTVTDTVDLGGTWATTDKDPSDDGHTIAKIVVNTSNEIESIELATGDGTNKYSLLDYSAFTGSVIDDTAKLTGTIIFTDASEYSVNLTKTTDQDITFKAGYKTGDSVALDTGKTLTIGTQAYTTVGDTTVIGGSYNGAAVPVITGGALSVTGADSLVMFYGTGTAGSEATITSTITVTGAAALASSGDVTGAADGTIVSGVLTGKTVSNTAALAADKTVTVNDELYYTGGAHANAGDFTVEVTDSGSILKKGIVKIDADQETYSSVSTATDEVSITAGNVLVNGTAGTVTMNGACTFTTGDSEYGRTTYSVTTPPIAGTGNYWMSVTDSTGEIKNYETATGSIGTSTVNLKKGKDTLTTWADIGTISYAHAEDGSTLEIPSFTTAKGYAIFHSGDEGSVPGDGDQVYAYAQKTSTTTYTIKGESSDTALFADLTVDTSALGSGITVNVDNTGLPTSTVYKNSSFTIGNVADGSSDGFTIKGSVLGGLEDNSSLSITSGAVTVAGVSYTTGASKGLTVTTAEGAAIKIEGQDTSVANGQIKITSAGVISGTFKADAHFTVAANAEASEDDTYSMTLNKESYTVVATTNTTVYYNAGKYYVTAGSVVVGAGETKTYSTNTAALAANSHVVKVTGGTDSNGIVLNADGSFSGLEEGETVKVYAADGTTLEASYSFSGGMLQVDSVVTGVKTSMVYTVDGDSVAFGAAYGAAAMANAHEPSLSDVTKINDTGFAYNATLAAGAAITGSTYVDKTGAFSLSDSKAVGQFSVANGVLSYSETEGVTSAQKLGIGALSSDFESWNVTTSSGKDTIVSNTANSSATTINSAEGNDTIEVAGTGDHIVAAGDGNDFVDLTATSTAAISVSGGAGKDTLRAGANVKGDVVLDGGEGNDSIVGGADVDSISLIGGTGNDTITAGGANNYVVGGDGNDYFQLTNNITVSDYKFGEDYLVGNWAGATYSSDGTVTIGGKKADISASATDGYIEATFYNSGTKKNQNVAWVGESGVTINESEATSAFFMKGDINSDAGDMLLAGSGKDTIVAGANDSVSGGAGDDSIDAGSNANVVIGYSAGKDTVEGFKYGFEESGSILLGDVKLSDLSISYATVAAGTGSTTIKSSSSNYTILNKGTSAGAKGTAELLIGGSKVALGAANSTITAGSTGTSYADVFYGNKSYLDFSSADDALFVNLTETDKYKGIATVKGGANGSNLWGSNGADVLVGNSGETTLWGGAGDDSLVGGSGKDLFAIHAGDGKDTITSFAAGTADTSDVLSIFDGSFSSIAITDTSKHLMTATLQDGTKAIIKGATNLDANSKVQVSLSLDGDPVVVKAGTTGGTAGNNFSYDSDVNFYFGGSLKDTLTVTSSDDVNIWMDGSNKSAVYSSVDIVNAANMTGNAVIVGDSASQTIVGGKGESNLLWGGAGTASDSLKGGSGTNTTNTFFWGFMEVNEGNDIVTGVKDGDTIYTNLSLSQLVADGNFGLTETGLVLTTKEGNTLTVDGLKDKTITLVTTDGSFKGSKGSWSPAN